MKTDTTESKASWAGHTPGPWVAVMTPNPYIRTMAPLPNNFGAICSLQIGTTGIDWRMAEANARLIACAPKMAATLRKIYDSSSTNVIEDAQTIRDIQDCLVEAGLIQ